MHGLGEEPFSLRLVRGGSGWRVCVYVSPSFSSHDVMAQRRANETNHTVCSMMSLTPGRPVIRHSLTHSLTYFSAAALPGGLTGRRPVWGCMYVVVRFVSGCIDWTDVPIQGPSTCAERQYTYTHICIRINSLRSKSSPEVSHFWSSSSSHAAYHLLVPL